MDGYRYSEHIRDGVLRFSYPNGKMAINLPSFFPSEAARLRKLLKTIDLVYIYEERGQIARELLAYLEERYDPKETEAVLRNYANATVDFRTKVKEIEEPIIRQAEKVRRMEEFIRTLTRGKKRKPYKDKLKEEKEALKALKEKQRGYKGDAAFSNGRFIAVQAERKRFEKNKEIIREFLADRF